MIVTPRNAADIVMNDPKLSRIEELSVIVAEGTVLGAVRAEPFLWRNLSKKAFEILTEDLCSKIEKEHGIKIERARKSGPASAMNCSAAIQDIRSVEDCMVTGASRYLFFSVSRDAEKMHITCFNC